MSSIMMFGFSQSLMVVCDLFCFEESGFVVDFGVFPTERASFLFSIYVRTKFSLNSGKRGKEKGHVSLYV